MKPYFKRPLENLGEPWGALTLQNPRDPKQPLGNPKNSKKELKDCMELHEAHFVVVVVVWGTWSFGMYDHGLRFLLTFMPTLLTLCRSFARTYHGLGSLSTLPWTPHQLTAEVYPHRVSTSVSAWDYLASTHANTSAVKHSGPASLPRKSQAARNGGIPLWAGGGYLFSMLRTSIFACASTSSVSTYVCIHSLFIPQAVYTHICLYICIYSRAYIFTIVLWLLEGTTPPLPFTESVFPPKSQIMQTFCSAENLVWVNVVCSSSILRSVLCSM